MLFFHQPSPFHRPSCLDFFTAKSNFTVSSPILECSSLRSFSKSPPPPRPPFFPSKASGSLSRRVFFPFSASSATRALNVVSCLLRLAFILMVFQVVVFHTRKPPLFIAYQL